jgi:hypothetical protein
VCRDERKDRRRTDVVDLKAEKVRRMSWTFVEHAPWQKTGERERETNVDVRDDVDLSGVLAERADRGAVSTIAPEVVDLDKGRVRLYVAKRRSKSEQRHGE